MKWSPLFNSKSDVTKILDTLELISKSLIDCPNTNPDLFSGNAGVSLYWQYLFQYTKDRKTHERSLSLLESSLDALGKTPLSYTYCTGVAGILWNFCHFSKNRFISANLDDFIGKEFDNYITESVKTGFINNNSDYLHGAMGPALYSLERTDNNACLNTLKDVVNGLNQTSVKFDDGIAWNDFMEPEKEKYILGLAHGSPGMVVVLSKIYQVLNSDLADQLIKKSVRWILSKKKNTSSGSLFPSVFPYDQDSNSRLSWCYGDLGIAVALFQAGKETGNEKWISEGISIAKYSCTRKSLSDNGVLDVCFCHGTAGIAHIFNRFFQYTQEEVFREASRYWFYATIDMCNREDGMKIFIRDTKRGTSGYELRTGILEGIAGVGLSLIGSIHDNEPKWDRCFLLS